MKLIGVIDLLRGSAVHARGGCRHGYRPVDTAAERAIDGDASVLADVYLRHLGVDGLYIADLDAIAGAAEQDGPVRAIAVNGTPLWLDAGVSTVAQAERALGRGATSVVVGLESLASFRSLRDISDAITPARLAFSLDLRDGRPITPDESVRALSPGEIAARATDAGAGALIVLDLARIGSSQGVDMRVLEQVKHAAPGVPLMAGGGVRDEGDLRSLGRAGCEGVLVATALHGPGGADLARSARSGNLLTGT